MTGSTEAGALGAAAGSADSGALDTPAGATLAGWRVQADGEQEEALPSSGAVTVSCSAPLGTGGLGRHLQELVDALERRAQTRFCISGSTRAAVEAGGAGGDRAGAEAATARTWLAARALRLPLPLSPGLRARASATEFDAFAARRLPAAEHLIAFNGQALAQLAAAKRAGYRSSTLVSANSHIRQVIRQHERAWRQYPFERSWASRMMGRNLREYERADRVYVASRYIRDSFLEQGFPEERLSWFPLTSHPRFDGVGRAPAGDTFEVVYVGSLAVHKGVPLLIDAIRRLPFEDLRLTLVGGWGTRGMRKFVERACAADRRIAAGPGDPLPRLAGARLCVHPAFEDGFAYAPAEALAAGVPVIVSEDTGMKDLIDAPRAGLVVPTGDLDALTAAIEAAYRGELFGGR
ncbi:MAG TPA: glycosyltransferase family 4 protein [Solirubrobacteraceae bacterium]|jgi:glycosyltransferase involved in cell wall biosynthesis|nr:glycosyltransferase family 4 protein [Solirubrobacteraceae bacterium]